MYPKKEKTSREEYFEKKMPRDALRNCATKKAPQTQTSNRHGSSKDEIDWAITARFLSLPKIHFTDPSIDSQDFKTKIDWAITARFLSVLKIDFPNLSKNIDSKICFFQWPYLANILKVCIHCGFLLCTEGCDWTGHKKKGTPQILDFDSTLFIFLYRDMHEQYTIPRDVLLRITAPDL